MNFENKYKSKFPTDSISFKSKEIITDSKKNESNVYLIESGYVKVFDPSQPKKNILILKEGEAFPLIWAFDHPGETVYCYQAFGKVTVSRTSIISFKEALNSDLFLSRESLIMFVYLSWDLMERVKCLQMPYTYEKLVRVLPYLAAKMGKPVGYGLYLLPKLVTQEQIAFLIGTSRESISAHFKKARSEYIIKEKSNGIEVNINKIPKELIHNKWFKLQI